MNLLGKFNLFVLLWLGHDDCVLSVAERSSQRFCRFMEVPSGTQIGTKGGDLSEVPKDTLDTLTSDKFSTRRGVPQVGL